MRRFLLTATILCVVTLYVLTLATRNTDTFTDYFWWIFSGAAILLSILLIVVGVYVYRLYHSAKKKEFGSKIARNLAIVFALVAVLPGVFLFGVSAQFIRYSINSWFGNDTDQVFEYSLDLSRTSLDLVTRNSAYTAAGLFDHPANNEITLAHWARERGFSQIILTLPNHQILTYNPEGLPETSENTGKPTVETFGNQMYAQGLLTAPNGTNVFFRQPLPKNIAQDAALLESARAKYAQLVYAQHGLQIFFLATLLMATLLAISLSLFAALYFSRRFTEPIMILAQSARRVAEGDLTHRPRVASNDELGQLQTLFNHMTAQLHIAREKQESARIYLERILNSLTSGVITLDENQHIKTFNHSAESILKTNLASLTGNHTKPILQAAGIHEIIDTIRNTAFQSEAVQTEYRRDGEMVILRGKATPLPAESGNGTVLVFDDITALVHAQKEAAWGEVAQRLAHEIRNPLTPIQLSAERIEHKLAPKISPEDAHMLHRATQTIIRQVNAMKEMVEAFRNYARATHPKRECIDLNELVQEVLVLYESSNICMDICLATENLWINADSGAIRQVIHNVLKNAVEAAEINTKPRVRVKTEHAGNKAVLTIEDNGTGFSPDVIDRAFEPYVTDKAGGTGLGLAVVKKIVEEHGGKVRLNNAQEGACIRIMLPEKQINHSTSEKK